MSVAKRFMCVSFKKGVDLDRVRTEEGNHLNSGNVGNPHVFTIFEDQDGTSVAVEFEPCGGAKQWLWLADGDPVTPLQKAIARDCNFGERQIRQLTYMIWWADEIEDAFADGSMQKKKYLEFFGVGGEVDISGVKGADVKQAKDNGLAVFKNSGSCNIDITKKAPPTDRDLEYDDDAEVARFYFGK